KGYDKITIVNEDSGTEFKIFAKDGHSGGFSCGSVCTKKGAVTTEACQASGGRGLDSAGKCLCDWTNNGNNQHLHRGSNGLCECQTGYQRIDPNNLKLGCVSKAFSQDLQNYKKAVEQFDKKYSEVDTAVAMVKQSMESIEKARSLEDVNKYGYKTGLDTWVSATKKRVTEATNLYNQAVTKYNGLSAEDQAKTKTDSTLTSKATLDAHKNEVNNALHEAEGYAQRAQTAYDKLLKDEEDRNAGIDVAERQRMNSCIDSHGQWDGKKCSCARDRGLKLSYDECECINTKWLWCPEKNACRPSTDC
ncbi:MAG: hypothetical protein J5613_03845, partial [Alphaproteobacteria bacterium]|nr:hypothetical protein [Alphaproteobacteria bacterium]